MLLTKTEDRKFVVSDQPLFYEDETGPGAVMAYLNELRKQQQFADVHLSIENHIVPAHRAVLACCSPYLFDFYKEMENNSIPLKHRLENVNPAAIELLVNFAYTGRLVSHFERFILGFNKEQIIRAGFEPTIARALSTWLSTSPVLSVSLDPSMTK